MAMRTSLYLKTQTELVDECEARMNDSGNVLATATQYKEAVNEAIQMWGNRVVLPRVYEFTNGFVSGTYEYTLPAYIKPPFDVQIKSSSYNFLGVQSNGDDTNRTWHSLAGYEIEPDTSGNWQIRLPSSPYTEDARIIWYAPNSPMPTATIQLTASMTSTDTTLTITEEGQYLGDTNLFRIDYEWMASHGLTKGTSSQRFDNILRGYGDTAAAAHNTTPVNINFGVGVDDQRLWLQLYDYVAYYIHSLQMHKSTSEDLGRHEKLMSFYKQSADNFWRASGYVSQRVGRYRLSPYALGGIAW